jgi:plasmid maintenance system antidote protein VapI
MIGIFAHPIKTTQKPPSMAKPHRIHIGHLIKDVFDKKGMSVAEFARRINCARPNVYSIFERYDIGVEQLIDISEALDHNFFDDIQLKSGLTSSLQTRQMNVRFNLESFSEEKAERIGILLKELKELVEE